MIHCYLLVIFDIIFSGQVYAILIFCFCEIEICECSISSLKHPKIKGRYPACCHLVGFCLLAFSVIKQEAFRFTRSTHGEPTMELSPQAKRTTILSLILLALILFALLSSELISLDTFVYIVLGLLTVPLLGGVWQWQVLRNAANTLKPLLPAGTSLVLPDEFVTWAVLEIRRLREENARLRG